MDDPLPPPEHLTIPDHVRIVDTAGDDAETTVTTVRAWLDTGGGHVDARDYYGDTLLTQASYHNHVEVSHGAAVGQCAYFIQRTEPP